MKKLTNEQCDYLLQRIHANDNTGIDVYLSDNPTIACKQGIDAILKKIDRIIHECAEHSVSLPNQFGETIEVRLSR